MRDKVFISYRRADSDAIAQKLYVDFKLRYGEDRLYFDLVGSRIGSDFGQRIVNALNDSAVILAIIGPAWAESFRQGANEADWVQFEVAHALKLDAAWRVIPVLAEAKMPAARELPGPVAQITRLQAVQLSRKANGLSMARLAGHASLNDIYSDADHGIASSELRSEQLLAAKGRARHGPTSSHTLPRRPYRQVLLQVCRPIQQTIRHNFQQSTFLPHHMRPR
jgi:TIR domain